MMMKKKEKEKDTRQWSGEIGLLGKGHRLNKKTLTRRVSYLSGWCGNAHGNAHNIVASSLVIILG